MLTFSPWEIYSNRWVFSLLTSMGLTSLVPVTIHMDLYILETSSILAKTIIKPHICIITVIYKMLEGMFKNYS